MAQHRNARRVEGALVAAGLDVTIRELPHSTRTAPDAAAALGVSVGQIAKTLVFVADGEAVVVVASGADRVDTDRLARYLGATRINQADADAVRAATQYPIGGVSPAGLDAGLRVVVDGALAAFNVVWAAAGTPNAVFSTTFDQLLRLTGGDRADVRVGPPLAGEA